MMINNRNCLLLHIKDSSDDDNTSTIRKSNITNNSPISSSSSQQSNDPTTRMGNNLTRSFRVSKLNIETKKNTNNKSAEKLRNSNNNNEMISNNPPTRNEIQRTTNYQENDQMNNNTSNVIIAQSEAKSPSQIIRYSQLKNMGKYSSHQKQPHQKKQSKYTLLLQSLDSDSIWNVLDFYGGVCNKSLSTPNKKIMYKEFMRRYYGRFKDGLVRFMFRFIEIDFNHVNSPSEIFSLISIPLLSIDKFKLNKNNSGTRYIFNHCTEITKKVRQEKDWLKMYSLTIERRFNRFCDFIEHHINKIEELDITGTYLYKCPSLLESIISKCTNLTVFKGEDDCEEIFYNIEDSFEKYPKQFLIAFEKHSLSLRRFSWKGSPLPFELSWWTRSLEYLEISGFYSFALMQSHYVNWNNLKVLKLKRLKIIQGRFRNQLPESEKADPLTKMISFVKNMKRLRYLDFGDDISSEDLSILAGNTSIESLSLQLFSKPIYCDSHIVALSTFANLKQLSVALNCRLNKSVLNILKSIKLEQLKIVETEFYVEIEEEENGEDETPTPSTPEPVIDHFELVDILDMISQMQSLKIFSINISKYLENDVLLYFNENERYKTIKSFTGRYTHSSEGYSLDVYGVIQPFEILHSDSKF